MKRSDACRIAVFFLCAVLLFSGCGQSQQPSSPSDAPVNTDPEPYDPDAIVVSDVEEFLAALGPDRTIVVDAESLALDMAADYGFSYSDGSYTWEQIDYSSYGLLIRNTEGLTIRGGANGTKITTGVIWADVLRFENCSGLTLSGLTLGHRAEPGACSGDVIDLAGCDGCLIENCDLYGCGAVAVNALECSVLTLQGCTLRDCAYSALNITYCHDFQARDCSVLHCGNDSPLAVFCVAGCNGFALINCTIEDCDGMFLMDAMGSREVFLLGCKAEGNRLSEALLRLYDRNIVISGCALSDNAFGSCYGDGSFVAETAAGEALVTFADFVHMEHRPFTGEYVGPEPYVTPSDTSAPAWDGERTEVHVSTVEEMLAAIAPHTTVYLDGEEFNLSTAFDYGWGVGYYYVWADSYDGPELVLQNLDDFSLVGGGMGVTLISAEPRYANVLTFEDCRNISIEDMTLGHTPDSGYCTGDVLELNRCEDVSITRCGLFGCGAVGIRAAFGNNLAVTDTNIYDCSYLGAALEIMQDVRFSGCSITNCGGEGGFNGMTLFNCTDVSYDNDRIFSSEYYVDAVG